MTGIDFDNKLIEQASSNSDLKNLNFIAKDAVREKFDQNYDVIILSNVLEHIEDRNISKKIKCIEIRPKILIRVPLFETLAHSAERRIKYILLF